MQIKYIILLFLLSFTNNTLSKDPFIELITFIAHVDTDIYYREPYKIYQFFTGQRVVDDLGRHLTVIHHHEHSIEYRTFKRSLKNIDFTKNMVIKRNTRDVLYTLNTTPISIGYISEDLDAIKYYSNIFIVKLCTDMELRNTRMCEYQEL